MWLPLKTTIHLTAVCREHFCSTTAHSNKTQLVIHITNRPKAEHHARTQLINMAEEDEQMEVAEEVEVEEVEAAPAAEMTVVDGLKEVLKKALIFDGLRRGLHE